MEITISSEEKLLNKRKLYVKFIVVLMVFLLIVFNLGSWLFFNKMEDFLEDGLARRLFSIAALAANNIEITPGVSIDDFIFFTEQNSDAYLLIQSKLRSLQNKYELEGVYIIDFQSKVLIDGKGIFHEGTKLTYMQQDSMALRKAWAGKVAVSPIHIIEGNRFKNVYAPLTNIMGDITAILALEANAEFFNIINLFRRGLIVSGLASLGAIILFSLFLAWTINLLINTQKSLRKTEKLALLGQMAASVAHEIRNPLGIIKATGDVVKLKYENKEQPDELFDYIGAEVNRLNNLVTDFLSFARERKLDKKNGSVLNTIQKAVTAFELDCQEKNITIAINAKNEIKNLNFDDEKIHQVLYNLLANATQAINEDRGEVTVEVNNYNKKGENFVEIKVIDTGQGIEGDLEKIFEPFYTTKSSGSGLGLAITKQIIEKHGGWIDVESVKNKGTTVKLYLPMI